MATIYSSEVTLGNNIGRRGKKVDKTGFEPGTFC